MTARTRDEAQACIDRILERSPRRRDVFEVWCVNRVWTHIHKDFGSAEAAKQWVAAHPDCPGGDPHFFILRSTEIVGVNRSQHEEDQP